MGSSELVVTSLNCAKLDTAQPQLILSYILSPPLPTYWEIFTKFIFFTFFDLTPLIIFLNFELLTWQPYSVYTCLLSLALLH